MATKPSSKPEWATDGGADITEPSLGKKQAGWIAEAPPHDFFNWWMNLVYLWVLYLDDLASQSFTWIGTHVFSADVLFNGDIICAGEIAYVPDHHYVGSGGGEPAFNTNWADTGGGNSKLTFTKLATGEVCIQGFASRTTGNDDNVFTLPSTPSAHYWRPTTTVYGTGQAGSGIVAVTVLASGVVSASIPDGAGDVFLNIRFFPNVTA